MPQHQHEINNESVNPQNAFPTHNINKSNSSKTNRYHEQSNVNSISNKNHNNNSKIVNEDNDVEAELEDLKRFERASKQESNHNHEFDPEHLAALHQHHHHNHNVQQTQVVSNSNRIHEAAFATHSKPLNGKGTEYNSSYKTEFNMLIYH